MQPMPFIRLILAGLAGVAIVGCGCPGSDVDYSRAVEKLAVPSTEYPLAGFWKWSDPPQPNDAGVAIAPAGNGMYSISFCGTVADFRPGEWTDNSKIYGDPSYKVVDLNTIEIKGEGGVWSRLYRFASRTTTRPSAPVNPSWPTL
jgi:hypothetical protein